MGFLPAGPCFRTVSAVNAQTYWTVTRILSFAATTFSYGTFGSKSACPWTVTTDLHSSKGLHNFRSCGLQNADENLSNIRSNLPSRSSVRLLPYPLPIPEAGNSAYTRLKVHFHDWPQHNFQPNNCRLQSKPFLRRLPRCCCRSKRWYQCPYGSRTRPPSVIYVFRIQM